MSTVLTNLIYVVVPAIIGFSAGIIKLLVNNKINKAESNQIAEEVRKIQEIVNKEDNGILDLMYKNVLELKEYYVISKRHANSSFTASLVACCLGVVIYLIGIIISMVTDANVALLSTIAGSIVEAISGLFFWIHNKSIEQLNIYHQRLGTTEKYLISIQLIDNISDEKKDENYRFLMESILCDNRTIIEKVNTIPSNK